MLITEANKANKSYPNTCKVCVAKEAALRYEMRDHRLKLIESAKKRSKDRGHKFDLTKDDIVLNKLCPLLDIPLDYSYGRGRGGLLDTSPCLDRIDNNKGYVKGNVWVISAKANRIKSNATYQEIRQVALRLKKVVE